MKFRPDGPDIPDNLVALQERGDTIFICGAGVSRMVGLPSFRGLVEAVYRDLGEDWSQHAAENEVMRDGGSLANQYDRMLRSLERRLAASDLPQHRGMRGRIRTAVRRALSLPEHADLRGHLALLELSRDAEAQSRLITTNFDTLFERAWRESHRASIASHAHSAMPQPKASGFAGVLHLHGRLGDENPELALFETDLVLTSAEFGDAYLRSGWASRYVYDVVRAHTVVLVGYEADDPPMRYVLESDRERYSDLHLVYAFAPCEPGNESLVTALWKAKGVEPILYGPRENDHSPLYDSLRECRRYAGDPTAWRCEQLRPILNGAPKDQTPEGLVRCVSLLGHGDASRLLAELSPTPDWIAPLSDRKVLGADGARPGEWIASRLNDAEMIRACAELPMLDNQSIWHVEREIEKIRGDLSAIRLKAWQLILKSKRPDRSRDARQDWFHAARYIRQGEAGHDNRQIVRQMLQPRLRVRKAYRLFREADEQASESLERLLMIDFVPSSHPPLKEIMEAWPESIDQEVTLFRVLERGVIEALEEADDLSYLDGWDRASADVPSIAAHRQNAHHDQFHPITRTMADLWSRIALRDRDKARSLISGWGRSPYLLVRRIFLFAMRAEAIFTAEEVWSALAALNDDMFWGGNAQVEIMRLATGRWRELAAAEREAFELRIRGGLPRALFPPEAFQKEDDWTSVRDSTAMKRLTRLRASGWPITLESQATLDEITGRHPKWTPGAGDRDDFAVWHESRWGPDGQPELLAKVADDVLVSEAMRLQRERQFDQGDVWQVFAKADPERAYRGLRSEADAGRWEPIVWRDLLWAASDKGDPTLQFEVAESLLTMPAAMLGNLLPAAASWLQKRRESLKGEPPDEAIFLRLWDRLGALTYPPDAPAVEELERDLVTTALNDPAGSLAWTFLDHVAEEKPAPDSRLRPEYASRLILGASAPGRPGLLARVLLMRSLAYIESIDHQWTVTYLIPGLFWNRPHAAAMWRSFAGGSIGTARLFNAAKTPMLEAFAQPTMADHDLEGLMVQFLNIALAHLRGEALDYLLTPAEIKRALSSSPRGLRANAIWQLWHVMGDAEGEPADKSARWRQLVGPLFQEIWPLDAKFRDEHVSENLVLLTLECGEAFEEAVNTVIDFIVPYQLYLIAHSLRLQKEHDAAFQELLFGSQKR
jgi:hypothetical protein